MITVHEHVHEYGHVYGARAKDVLVLVNVLVNVNEFEW